MTKMKRVATVSTVLIDIHTASLGRGRAKSIITR